MTAIDQPNNYLKIGNGSAIRFDVGIFLGVARRAANNLAIIHARHGRPHGETVYLNIY